MLSNRSMPESPVIPVLAYEDVGEAVDWLCETFGFSERWRAGSHRAQLSIGDAAVAITEGGSGSGGANVMVRVEDVDAHYARAVRAGAEITRPLADTSYGSREYGARDIEGHYWYFGSYLPATG